MVKNAVLGYWRECFAGFGEKTRDLERHLQSGYWVASCQGEDVRMLLSPQFLCSYNGFVTECSENSKSTEGDGAPLYVTA